MNSVSVMTNWWVFASLLLATCMEASVAAAQRADTARVGAHVRFRSVGMEEWRTGTVVSASHEALLVRSCSHCADSLVTLRAGDLAALEGRRGGVGSRRLNVTVGAAIGVLAGVALTIHDTHRCSDIHADGPPCASLGLIALPVVAAVGGLVGALGGHSSRQRNGYPWHFPTDELVMIGALAAFGEVVALPLLAFLAIPLVLVLSAIAGLVFPIETNKAELRRVFRALGDCQRSSGSWPNGRLVCVDAAIAETEAR